MPLNSYIPSQCQWYPLLQTPSPPRPTTPPLPTTTATPSLPSKLTPQIPNLHPPIQRPSNNPPPLHPRFPTNFIQRPPLSRNIPRHRHRNFRIRRRQVPQLQGPRPVNT